MAADKMNLLEIRKKVEKEKKDKKKNVPRLQVTCKLLNSTYLPNVSGMGSSGNFSGKIVYKHFEKRKTK